jgi:hypothetical protein
MPGIHDFALFVASGILLNLTPGADTLYIVPAPRRWGVTQGRSRRWASPRAAVRTSPRESAGASTAFRSACARCIGWPVRCS